MTPTLTALLQKARDRKMTAAEMEEQRINFAYGNAGEDEEGTKEAVRAAATHMKETEAKKSAA